MSDGPDLPGRRVIIDPTERGARDIARCKDLIDRKQAVRLTHGAGPPHFYGADVLYRSWYDGWNRLYRGCVTSIVRERLGNPDTHGPLSADEFGQIVADDLTRARAAYEKAR